MNCYRECWHVIHMLNERRRECMSLVWKVVDRITLELRPESSHCSYTYLTVDGGGVKAAKGEVYIQPSI